MHFDESFTLFPILMWFWVEQVLKLTNLTKWMNNQNHARAMKIQPKTEKLNMTWYDRILILDHEETSFIQFWDVFYEIQLKISFYNLWWKSLSHGIRWKNALCFKNCVRSLSFHTWKIFHTSQTSMRWKLLTNRTKSSLLSKISSKLSLLVSPVALQS